jgi:hypothetical protein
MIHGKQWMVGSFDDDTEECSLCRKSKEGVVLQEEDGSEFNLCSMCLKKMNRLRRAARARAESVTPSFPSMKNGG